MAPAKSQASRTNVVLFADRLDPRSVVEIYIRGRFFLTKIGAITCLGG